MFVAMNRLSASTEVARRLEGGFAGAGPRMQGVAGCIGFRLLRAQSGGEGAVLYIAETTWQDEASYRAWVAGDAFTQAHSRDGAGGPMRAVLELFEVVSG